MSRTSVIRVLTIAAVLVVWEAVRRFGLVGPLLLAAPSEILAAAIQSPGEFFSAFQLTVGEILAAIAICWGLGIATGLAAGMIASVGAASGPIFSSLFAVPLITWYPLFMVWFGIGPASKIAYAVVSGFFPVALGTLNGVRGLDRRYLTFGRAIGCSRWQTISRILFPLAVPSIVSGLRIGTALAVIGVIVAEMLASLGGLGFLISHYRSVYAIGEVYFGIALALLCAVIANWGLSAIEQHFMRWRDLQTSVHG
jgi:NitT/TauT family transport system permease protein